MKLENGLFSIMMIGFLLSCTSIIYYSLPLSELLGMRMRLKEEGFCILMILIASIHVAASQMTGHKKCLEATIAECFPGDELFMESEVSYRFLAGAKAKAKPISYGALIPNKGICKGRTPAYSSCLPGSNKGYDRGCKSIYRCRPGIPGSS